MVNLFIIILYLFSLYCHALRNVLLECIASVSKATLNGMFGVQTGELRMDAVLRVARNWVDKPTGPNPRDKMEMYSAVYNLSDDLFRRGTYDNQVSAIWHSFEDCVSLGIEHILGAPSRVRGLYGCSDGLRRFHAYAAALLFGFRPARGFFPCVAPTKFYQAELLGDSQMPLPSLENALRLIVRTHFGLSLVDVPRTEHLLQPLSAPDCTTGALDLLLPPGVVFRPLPRELQLTFVAGMRQHRQLPDEIIRRILGFAARLEIQLHGAQDGARVTLSEYVHSEVFEPRVRSLRLVPCVLSSHCVCVQAKREANAAHREANAAKREATRGELRAHTVAQLKAMCAQHGLRKTGAKEELVARLCDVLCTDEPAAKRRLTEVRAARCSAMCDGGQQRGARKRRACVACFLVRRRSLCIRSKAGCLHVVRWLWHAARRAGDGRAADAVADRYASRLHAARSVGAGAAARKHPGGRNCVIPPWWCCRRSSR